MARRPQKQNYTRYVIEDTRHVPPFNQPASLLTIGTRPLKVHQEELLGETFGEMLKLGSMFTGKHQLNQVRGPAIVYADNLWFDREFLDYFISHARETNQACRAAFDPDDPAWRAYVLPLATDFERATDERGRTIYLLNLWYFPADYTPDILPIVIPSDHEEMGFYSVPDFMTMEQGDLTHYAPERAFMSIESWVHVYFASIIFTGFARGSRFDKRARRSNGFALGLLWRAVLEQRQLLSSSLAVKIGKNTNIHPTAVITGPAVIGDGCSIGPGVMLDNVTIGNNVTIDDGCVLMMSTVADGCFLPFRASLYLTAVMENTIIAQNTCLQMCVIGRNSFVGAGSTFTDFNLLAQKPIRAANIHGALETVGQVVLGSAVGHNCRIGSGMVLFPGRMIESDVVMVASPARRVVARNIAYEESDHHTVSGAHNHRRQYPRIDEEAGEEETWDRY